MRPGVDPGQGRAGARRGAGALPGRRPDARRARARQDPVRGPASSAGSSASAGSAASPTCWPRARCSPGGRISTRCSSAGSAAATAAQVRGAAAHWLSRRRLHARGPAVPRVSHGADRRGPLSAAPGRPAAQGRISRARARHTVQRAQDRPRASGASIPQVRFDLLVDAGYRPPTSSPSPARRASP